MKVTVLGYYGHSNLGDDLFQHVLSSWFDSYDIQIDYSFVDPNRLKSLPPADVVLVAAGDLATDYFMLKIKELTKDFKGPIYGFGIGFPYQKLINPEYLAPFDLIVTRSFSSLEKLKEVLPKRVRYSEDLVFDLAHPLNRHEIKLVSRRRKEIGVFLASTVVKHPISPQDPILLSYIEVIRHVLEKYKNFRVNLYAMNTGKNEENDNLLNEQIYYVLQHHDNLSLHRDPIEPSQAISLFSSLTATICTRYHATILSIATGTPLLAIYSTAKIHDLIHQRDLSKFAVQMETNPSTLMPTHFCIPEALNKFDLMFANTKEISRAFMNTVPDLSKTKQFLENLLFYKPIYRFVKTEEVYEKVQKFIKDHQVDPEFIAAATTYAITGTEEAPFTWGLKENLSKGADLKGAIDWILKNTSQEEPWLDSDIPIHQRKYNFAYFNQDLLAGLHRSGWQYVVDKCKLYHNPNGPIFDSYGDKTFGWRASFYQKIGVLPFKQKFVLTLHHLPDDAYDENNLTDLVKSDLFVQSLPECEAIIVLSNYVKEWLEKNLAVKVPIRVAYHPMPEFEQKWSLSRFRANKEKRLVQIGAWMRNTASLIMLDQPKNMKKAILVGKKMEGYFPAKNFMEELEFLVSGMAGSTPSSDKHRICRHRTNKFLVGLVDYIRSKLTSVEIIQTLSNSEYDKLITENVVFLNLVDVSACNTVLECLRNDTPLIINKLPAAIEYLGASYPLFYESLEEAIEIANDETRLIAGHLYLQRMNKEVFNFESFAKLVLL